MTKVAYLFGLSGSGKGYIAKQLEKDVQVITVDKVRDKAARRLSAHDIGLWHDWDRRHELFRTFDVPSIFSTILTEDRAALSDDQPVLAEGFDLGHDGWREAFRAALVARGITITVERIFWIHPPAEVVRENRHCRGRKAQSNESLEDVRQHRDCYHERVSHHSNCRYEDAEEAIRAIREFLLR